jgi:hypothetical protein
MGHYYSGRGVVGTIVLGLAGGAIASGLLVREVQVLCLNTPASGADCPQNEILDETTNRPLLVPAIAAAGAITLIGAIEAFVRARGRRAEQAEAIESLGTDEVRLVGPSVSVRDGRMDLTVLGLRFR